MKPGIHTSEFWIAVLVIVTSTAALLTGSIDSDAWSLTTASVAGAYGLSRGLAKKD